ncbi:MAG: trans-sulfuration enzyme family protein [Candidatus Limnocylindrales bacterium]|jgi:cystathionine beta-lyase/cystathionine gamma-synthase
MQHDAGRGFSTRAIRAAGRSPRLEQVPTAVPIYQTATFRTADSSELADVLTDRRQGYAYSRIANPTSGALADAVAEIEGAAEGFAFGTGMGAIFAALASQVSSGDEIVASSALYGSTRSLLERELRRFGVPTRYVDVTDPAAVEAAFTQATRVLYVETISNPTIVVADLAQLAAVAHRHSTALVVDNTFASPYLCRPAELGADLVVESATKWIAGHSDVMAGIVCGAPDRMATVRALQVNTGGVVAPFSAFLVLRGLTTLAVRMDRHSSTALALAEFLERENDVVGRVYYPGLPTHPQAEVARRQLRTGGGMLAFDLGSRVAGTTFLDALDIGERTASLGSVHTIAVHPPSTTHRQLDETELEQAGIAPGLVRMSVGLEDAADLLGDVSGALDVVRATV